MRGILASNKNLRPNSCSCNLKVIMLVSSTGHWAQSPCILHILQTTCDEYCDLYTAHTVILQSVYCRLYTADRSHTAGLYTVTVYCRTVYWPYCRMPAEQPESRFAVRISTCSCTRGRTRGGPWARNGRGELRWQGVWQPSPSLMVPFLTMHDHCTLDCT